MIYRALIDNNTSSIDNYITVTGWPLNTEGLPYWKEANPMPSGTVLKQESCTLGNT